MKGYVRNKTSGWRHAMKRSIGPGHKIPMDELFEQYGKKHHLEPGDQFVEWLKNVKLRDRSTWDIVLEDDVKAEPKESEETAVEEKKVDKHSNYQSVPFVKKDLEIDDIVNMTVRNARVELKQITDLRLLRQAHQQARQLAHKDTLCQYLRRRIQELELTRR
jgi:hypothetical protein